MADGSRALLRQTLLAAYADLKRSLAILLGSEDIANDVLHDTFLRVECGGEIGAVQNPRGYVFRIAMNLAHDRRRSERLRPSADDVSALLDVVDDAPDAARVTNGRQELDALKEALKELPERRRAIVTAAWLDEVKCADIARRFGLTEHMIRLELRRAREFCQSRVQQKN